MKRLLLLLIIGTSISCLFAQDIKTMTDKYIRDFIRADIKAKLDILKESGNRNQADMEPLLDLSFRFLLDYSEILEIDSMVRDLAIFTIKKTGELGNSEKASDIIRLFHAYNDSSIKVQSIIALGAFGTVDGPVINEINLIAADVVKNTFPEEKNDYLILETIIQTLGKIGNNSSYEILFQIVTKNLNSKIQNLASDALVSLKGDYKAFIINIIENNALVEKAIALKLSIESSKLSIEDRGFISEAALRVALAFQATDTSQKALLIGMRQQAILELTKTRWVRATSLIIKHMRETISEYAKGSVSKQVLLEAIACLGSMKSNEAAQALTLYLSSLNSETERGRPTDEQIALAVVTNIGLIGDKIAYDDILYVGYLKYPESVKKAALDTLSKLR